MKYLLILLLILLLLELYIAFKCLNLVVKPICYTEEQIRTNEINDGFGDAVNAYENDWDRKDFALERDGILISGETIANPDAKDKVAIILHGHTANRFASLKYAYMFYRKGYHIVIYDERHFGRSTGDFSTLGQEETKDLEMVYEYTKKMFPGCRIVLHGESMGAATSLFSLKDLSPDAVVADCPFCDTQRLFGEFIRANLHIPPILVLPTVKLLARLKYGYLVKDVMPIESVRGSDVPICFMHGKEDKLINCDHSVQMYHACRNPLSQLNLFDKADHARSVFVDKEKYEEIMYRFLDSCGL